MKIIKSKYWQYLFWLGPILTIMGITAGIVAGSWGRIPLGLLISGIVIIGLWLLFLVNSAENFWGRRSTQSSANALIATLAMLLILGLINFMSIRYAVRIDLTENKVFTLSPESQQIVRNLQQPLKVWIFEGENTQIRQLLANYLRYSSQFSFEFVNPQREPGLAQKFNVQRVGEIYLEYGKQRQLLQVLNEGEGLSEAKLTNGIEKIISDRPLKIYFLQGHGEHPLEASPGGLSQAVTVFKEKNYAAEPLNLAERLEVPKDATVVVIAGAKRPLFEAEVKAIRSYLQQGGSLLLMTDPNANPGLDNFLKEWGVKLDNRLVIDASGRGRLVGLGPATALINQYGQHPITKEFGNDFSFYPLARALDISPVKGIEQSPLLISDDKSWAESTPEKQPLEFNPESDRPGPLILGIALSRVYQPNNTAATSSANLNPSEIKSSPSPNPTTTPTPTESPEKSTNPQKKSLESRLVIFGNSDFASDGLFDKQLNGDVFINSVNWLSQANEKTLSIRPKEPKNRRINITPQQSAIVAFLAVILMPLLGLIVGGYMWWRRR